MTTSVANTWRGNAEDLLALVCDMERKRGYQDDYSYTDDKEFSWPTRRRVLAEGNLAEDLPPSDKPRYIRVKRRLVYPTPTTSASQLHAHDSWQLLPDLSSELPPTSDLLSQEDEKIYPSLSRGPSVRSAPHSIRREPQGEPRHQPPAPPPPPSPTRKRACGCTWNECLRSRQSRTPSPSGDYHKARCWCRREATPAKEFMQRKQPGAASPPVSSRLPRPLAEDPFPQYEWLSDQATVSFTVPPFRPKRETQGPRWEGRRKYASQPPSTSTMPLVEWARSRPPPPPQLPRTRPDADYQRPREVSDLHPRRSRATPAVVPECCRGEALPACCRGGVAGLEKTLPTCCRTGVVVEAMAAAGRAGSSPMSRVRSAPVTLPPPMPSYASHAQLAASSRSKRGQLWGGGPKMQQDEPPARPPARLIHIRVDRVPACADAASVGGLRAVPPPGSRQLPPAKSTPGPMLSSEIRGPGVPQSPVGSSAGQGHFSSPSSIPQCCQPGYGRTQGPLWSTAMDPSGRAESSRAMLAGPTATDRVASSRPASAPHSTSTVNGPVYMKSPTLHSTPVDSFRQRPKPRSDFQMSPVKEERSPYYRNEPFQKNLRSAQQTRPSEQTTYPEEFYYPFHDTSVESVPSFIPLTKSPEPLSPARNLRSAPAQPTLEPLPSMHSTMYEDASVRSPRTQYSSHAAPSTIRPVFSEYTATPKQTHSQVRPMYDAYCSTLKHDVSSAQPPVGRRDRLPEWSESPIRRERIQPDQFTVQPQWMTNRMPGNASQSFHNHQIYSAPRMETGRSQPQQQQHHHQQQQRQQQQQQRRQYFSPMELQQWPPASSYPLPSPRPSSSASPHSEYWQTKSIPPPCYIPVQQMPRQSRRSYSSLPSSQRSGRVAPRPPPSAYTVPVRALKRSAPASSPPIVESNTASSQTPPCNVYYPCADFKDALKACGAPEMDLSQPFVDLVRALPWDSVTGVRRVEEVFVTDPKGSHHEIVDITMAPNSIRPATAPDAAVSSPHKDPSTHSVPSIHSVHSVPSIHSVHSAPSIHSVHSVTSTTAHDTTPAAPAADAAPADTATTAPTDVIPATDAAPTDATPAAAAPTAPADAASAPCPFVGPCATNPCSAATQVASSDHSVIDSMHTAKSINSANAATPQAASSPAGSSANAADDGGDNGKCPDIGDKACTCRGEGEKNPCLEQLRKRGLPLSPPQPAPAPAKGEEEKGDPADDDQQQQPLGAAGGCPEGDTACAQGKNTCDSCNTMAKPSVREQEKDTAKEVGSEQWEREITVVRPDPSTPKTSLNPSKAPATSNPPEHTQPTQPQPPVSASQSPPLPPSYCKNNQDTSEYACAENEGPCKSCCTNVEKNKGPPEKEVEVEEPVASSTARPLADDPRALPEAPTGGTLFDVIFKLARL